MELNASKLALAATITMGALYTVCAAFTALNPDLAMRFLGWIIHLTNVDKFTAIKVTFGSFIVGLVPILAYTYAGTYVFAWLYNQLTKKSV